MMFYSIIWRLVLATFAASVPAKAFAFAVFTFNFGGSGLLPVPFGVGVPVTWKQSSVPVTLAFAPNPVAPLTNGTTTWNQNAISAMNEWGAVGANFAYSASIGVGNPCVSDGNIVAAFDPTLCAGAGPPTALGVTRLLAVADTPTSFRIVDADVAIIPNTVAAANGAKVTDAFDGPVIFPNADFRRLVLHEFGHVLGLAHPDEVFGDNLATQSTVMHSQSFAAIRLSADDRNGVLALYPAAAPPAPAPASNTGGDSGGGGTSGLLLAILMGAAAAVRLLYAAAFGRRRRPASA